MSGDICPPDQQKQKGRCAVTNGNMALLFGDGRSVGARRYRDLCSAFGSDLGEPLSAVADQVVRRLAQVSVELELMEATRAAGGAIDPVAFCTLVNVEVSLDPSPATAAMIAIEMPAAISPYSIAVAPLSSCRKSCRKGTISMRQLRISLSPPVSFDAANR